MTFFLLVFALAIPFLVIGAVTGIRLLPGLPVAALMAVCPATAALILVHQDDGAAGVKALLKRAFDYRRIRGKLWCAPILLLMPAVMALSFGVMRWSGTPVPAPQIAVVPALILCVAFFAGAAAEELGWSAYVIDPIQNRWGALGGSILVGLVWASSITRRCCRLTGRSSGSPGGHFGPWRCALSSSGSTTTRVKAYSPRLSSTPR